MATEYVTPFSYHNATSNLSEGDIVDKDGSSLWIASMVFTFILLPFLCYLIFAFSYHGYKKKMMPCAQDSGQNAKMRRLKIVNSLIVIEALATLFYVAVEIPLVGPVVHPFCAIYNIVKITLYGIALAAAYTALWYRVFTVFYVNPVLKPSLTTVARVANISSLLFLALSLIVNLTLFYSSPPYDTTLQGCKEVQSKNESAVKWSLLVSCTIAVQVSLLFSFIYPLYIHHKKNISKQGTDGRSVLSVVKRAAVVATVCIFSDLMNSGFTILYKNPIRYINHIVFSTNLTINLLGVILSFVDWREKLFPFNCFTKWFEKIKDTAEERQRSSSLCESRNHTLITLSGATCQQQMENRDIDIV